MIYWKVKENLIYKTAIKITRTKHFNIENTILFQNSIQNAYMFLVDFCLRRITYLGVNRAEKSRASDSISFWKQDATLMMLDGQWPEDRRAVMSPEGMSTSGKMEVQANARTVGNSVLWDIIQEAPNSAVRCTGNTFKEARIGKGVGGSRFGKLVLIGIRVSGWKDENVLEMDSDDGCTVWMY
jgi:hypothetical protein